MLGTRRRAGSLAPFPNKKYPLAERPAGWQVRSVDRSNVDQMFTTFFFFFMAGFAADGLDATVLPPSLPVVPAAFGHYSIGWIGAPLRVDSEGE
jgi:hypothetical protein